MHLCHRGVRRGRDDGEGRQRLPVRAAPPLPQSREGQRGAIGAGDRVGLLTVRHDLPLIESVGGDEAPPRGEGAAEHAGRGDGLGARIDRPPGGLKVLGEMRHQAPPQQVKAPLAALRMPPYDHGGLRRCHVPVGADVRQVAYRAEQVGDLLRGEMAGIATAQGGSLPRFRGGRPSGIRKAVMNALRLRTMRGGVDNLRVRAGQANLQRAQTVQFPLSSKRSVAACGAGLT